MDCWCGTKWLPEGSVGSGRGQWGAGVGSGSFVRCRARRQATASGVQSTLFLSCRLVSSLSIRDRIGMKGVVVAVVRWPLVCSVGGCAALSSDAVVVIDAGGQSLFNSLFSRF